MAADYYKNEELLIENAIPTAEGALAIAMEELPITIFGSKVLVTGYGRVAKTAAKNLFGSRSVGNSRGKKIFRPRVGRI